MLAFNPHAPLPRDGSGATCNQCSQPEWLNPQTWRSDRWRTAISRPRLSLPIRNALKSGDLPPGEWLDFGCGRGQDVEHLQLLRSHPVRGFDPYWHPKNELLEQQSKVVSLIYVLNVIESPDERNLVVHYAWELTVNSLVIAVRTDGNGEGFTSINTFQKYYKHKEFIALIESLLPTACIESVSSGVAIASRLR